jgi:predicted metalloprotease with PDZ domain
VLRGAGRTRQSIAASSFDAWTKFYKQDENAPNAIVSYYAKGALVAFGLDITLRLASDGSCSLDDLMRRLWQRFGKPDVGVPERGIEREVAELLGSPLDDFFAAYVRGTDELPLDDWFAALGIGWRLRPAADAEDTGGYRDDRAGQETVRPALGARFESQPEGLRLTHVLAGSAAQTAGLSAGDLLIAADNERLTASNLATQLQRAQGETICVHYFRRGLLRQTQVPRRDAPHDTCDLWFVDESALDATTLRRRQAWLTSNRRH